MTNTYKIIGGLAIVLVLVCVYLFGVSNREPSSLGSVIQSGEYHATTTASKDANSLHQIFTGSGTLGSVIIGTTHATAIELRDASSASDSASTSIASIAASPAIGSTMTFDVAVLRGLFVNVPSGFDGVYTITYR